MSQEYLKRLEKEDKELLKEYAQWELSGKSTPEKIAGFRLPKTSSLIPEIPCGQTAMPIMALLPLYETVLLPIYPSVPKPNGSVRKITKVSLFRSQHGLTPDELSVLAMKGRVIPYFVYGYSEYTGKLIQPLIQPGIPRLSSGQMAAFRVFSLFEASKDPKMKTIASQVTKDFPIYYKDWPENCKYCIGAAYLTGLRDLVIQKTGYACLHTYLGASQFLGAVLQTECPEAEKVFSSFEGLPPEISLDYIIQGLRIKHIPKMSLDVYADIFDGKTAKALRKIVGDLLNDPLASKYVERLNARIFDLNQQVEEIGEGKAAKIFEAVSDIAVYGGKKFIESKSHEFIRIPKKGMQRVAEWIASKGVDLQAKLNSKDWAVAQLYKARCKLEKCK